MFKKILAMVVCTVVLLSLAGCGSNSGNEGREYEAFVSDFCTKLADGGFRDPEDVERYFSEGFANEETVGKLLKLNCSEKLAEAIAKSVGVEDWEKTQFKGSFEKNFEFFVVSAVEGAPSKVSVKVMAPEIKDENVKQALVKVLKMKNGDKEYTEEEIKKLETKNFDIPMKKYVVNAIDSTVLGENPSDDKVKEEYNKLFKEEEDANTVGDEEKTDSGLEPASKQGKIKEDKIEAYRGFCKEYTAALNLESVVVAEYIFTVERNENPEKKPFIIKACEKK